MEKGIKKNERIALSIGLILIVLVAVITFSRSNKADQINNSELPEEDTSQYPKISPRELREKISKEESFRVLDIRRAVEYQGEHIIDSLNVPVDNLEEGLIDIDNDETVVIIGSNEADYKKAVEVLQSEGYLSVAVLTGGVSSWKQFGGQTVTVGNPESFIDQAKVIYIVSEELKNLVDNKAVFVLDTRNADAFSAGHISGAINIPVRELEKRRKELPRDSDIVAYGETDILSFQAGVQLYDLGFFTAKVLKGGSSLWKDKGLPLEN